MEKKRIRRRAISGMLTWLFLAMVIAMSSGAMVRAEENANQIQSLDMDGTSATVCFQTSESSDIVVAIYTSDGMQIQASGTASVSSSDSSVSIELEGTIPEFYCATAYLLRADSYEPLAASYSMEPVTAIGGTSGNVTWSLDDSGILTLSGNGEMEDYSGTNIPWYAYRESISEVVIESGITSVGDYAFYGCTGLVSVSLPEGIESIGNCAFDGCSSLTSLTLPESTISLGYFMIRDTAITSITIPKNVSSCEAYRYNGPLSGAAYLKKVVFEEGIETIPAYICGSRSYYDGSFWYATPAITEVVIPDGVLSIGDYAFYTCETLENISFPEGLLTVGEYAFYECTALTGVVFPDSVTKIGSRAFYLCGALENVTLSENLTVIGEYAFYNCTGIVEVVFQKNVSEVGQYAFSGCVSLEEIQFTYNDADDGYSLTIGNYAFVNCTSLSGVTLTENVVSIGTSAFAGCSALSSLILPESLTSLGVYAISGTAIASITIPKNLSTCGYSSSSGSGPLSGATELTTVVIEKGMTEIPGFLCASTSITEVEIPESVTIIGSSAFRYCDALISVELPATLQEIGNYAFDDCDSLGSVTFAGSSQGSESGQTEGMSINTCAFRNCVKLSEIVLPDTVVSIGNYVFDGCSSLTSLTLPDSVTNLGYYMIRGTAITSITIPKNVTSCGYFNRMGGPLAGALQLVEVIFADGMETIPGYACASYGYTSAISTVVIPDSVTAIGENAFYNCEVLASIDLPDGLETIGSYAFYNCDSLTGIDFPKSMTELGYYAFNGCGNLTSATFHTNISSGELACELTIDYGAFYDCENLVNVELSLNVVSIGNGAFTGCTSLSSLSLPQCLTYLGTTVISDTAITSIVIPASLTDCGVGGSASAKIFGPLAGAENLTEVIFTSGIKTIPSYICAFASSTSYITSVTIPSSVTEIEARAFYDCTSLTTIYFEGSAPKIGNNAFNSVCATAYYDGNYSGWTSDVMEGYGGEIVWVDINSEVVSAAAVAGTESEMDEAEVVSEDILEFESEEEDETSQTQDETDAETDAELSGQSESNDVLLATEKPDLSENEDIEVESETDGVSEIETEAATFDEVNDLEKKEETSEESEIGEENSSETETETEMTEKSETASEYESVAAEKEADDETEEIDGNDSASLVYSSSASVIPLASYSGSTLSDSLVLTSTFSGLAVNEDYVLLVVKDVNTDDMLSANNLLYIGQGTADSQGKLAFTYRLREETETFNAIVFGPEGETITEPDAPTIVSVYSTVQTSAKVTWTAVDGADGYQIYRSTEEDGTYTCIKTINSGSTVSYTNSGLTVGQTYYYKVRAYAKDSSNNWIYSDFSEVRYMPAAVVFSNVYSNLTTRIRILWNEVSGVEGYQIWRADSEDGTYKIVKTITSGDTVAYSNTGLESGQTYYYKMRAFTTADGAKVFGAYSDVVAVATMPETPELTVVSYSTSIAKLSWNEISGAAGYQIWRSDSENGTYTLVKSITNGSTIAYSNSGLESGSAYYYKVRAYTEVEGKKTFGDYSSVQKVTVK